MDSAQNLCKIPPKPPDDSRVPISTPTNSLNFPPKPPNIAKNFASLFKKPTNREIFLPSPSASAIIPPSSVNPEKGQQSKQNPEKGNNIAALNEENELVDGLNGIDQNLSTQVNLGDCVQQQIGEDMAKSQQTGDAPTSMERETQHRVGLQNDGMGVSKVLEKIGSSPLVQNTLDTPNVVGVSLETLPSPSPDPFINKDDYNLGVDLAVWEDANAVVLMPNEPIAGILREGCGTPKENLGECFAL
ncbi:unnamed protein product, partial [Ilex paraguariensis]